MKKKTKQRANNLNYFCDSRYATVALLFSWLALHMYLSDQRGFWVDEWFRHAQMSMGFFGALKDLFSEISPFAPGELILAYFNKLFFSNLFSEELWMRLHSIYFGFLTLWVAIRSKEKILVPLTFFSVAVTSLSTQFRPYSALIFGGALSFYLIRKKDPLDKVDQFFCWFNLFMGHIYGICFAGFAFFFRKEYVKVAASFLYLVIVMSIHYSLRTPFHFIRDIPQASDVVKQSLGTIGNPQRVSYFFLIFCIVGLWHSFKKNRREGFLLAAILFLSTAGPVIATYIGKYYFLPRQVAGGTVVFLGLAAIGLNAANERLKKFHKSAPLALNTLAILAIGASWLAFVSGRPPFIDQPLHRFEQIAKEAKDKNYKNILWLDPGTLGSGFFYFKSLYNDPKAIAKYEMVSGLRIYKLCVANAQVCVYSTTDDAFVWDAERMATQPKVKDLINGKVIPFDLVVHSFYRFPIETKTPLLRIW